MSIGKIIRSCCTEFSPRAALKKQNNIERYFKIHDTDTYGDSFEEMYNAKETIANYARHEGVKIDIYDAKKIFSEEEDFDYNFLGKAEEKFADKIRVVVTNLISGKSTEKFIEADTDRLYPKVTEKRKNWVMINIPGEDTQRVHVPLWKTEDTFLRNLYRNIEAMTKGVTDSAKINK